MRQFLTPIFLALALFALSPQRAAAQAAVNVASYANPNLPSGSLAQGGMFTAFGTNLGPAALQQAGSFPLPTSLAGTSIKVTVGGTTVDCIMVFTSAGQVAGILPSNTPTGAGTMTISYNGTATAPFAVTVVAHSFGTFGINSAGSGPGVFTNAVTGAVNTISSAAAPGSMFDIWGTGLGAVPFSDADLPTVQNLGYNVQVFVGGKQAQVIYAGRSGCCSGVDQIRFVVPDGVAGCYVPVYVVVNGVPSNFTSISIGAGGMCSDPGGLSSAALADGDLTVGIINLSRTSIDIDIAGVPGGISQSQTTESAVASYFGYDANGAIRQSLDNALFTEGACTVYQFSGEGGDYEDPVLPRNLDAGPSTSVTNGTTTATLSKIQAGQYLATLSTPSIPGLPFSAASQKALAKRISAEVFRASLGEGAEQSTSGFFNGGPYTYSAPGGADVGAHSKTLSASGLFDWTNKDAVNPVVRSQGQNITWTPFSGQTMIIGSSFQTFNGNEVFGAGFVCLANGQNGSFQIPASVLQLLPASTTFSAGGFTIETGSLSAGKAVTEECQASGLDICMMSYTDFASKQVGYR
ncbi:MAG: hypothetical protein KDC27_11475 [Acidobacteria bacterium]|nr:hypothetical protein [Acidobacteriota bacterium]